jgi:hypothetical protein
MDYTAITKAIARDAGLERLLPIYNWRKARSFPQVGIVEATPPHDDVTLAVFAHECGHLATTLHLERLGTSVLEIEAAASQWARNAIIRNGGTVTEAMDQVWLDGLASYA